jgi:hypothetical protein
VAQAATQDVNHMSLFNKNLRLPCAALALFLVTASANAAGLVGYRNDSTQAIVVQSSVTSNGRTSLSKPQTLYPGEVALDNLAFTGTRKITVYDAKNTKVVLFQGEVTNTDDVFYSVQKSTTVPIGEKPQSPPAFELVKVQAPVPKPGKSMPPTTPPVKKR